MRLSIITENDHSTELIGNLLVKDREHLATTTVSDFVWFNGLTTKVISSLERTSQQLPELGVMLSMIYDKFKLVFNY